MPHMVQHWMLLVGTAEVILYGYFRMLWQLLVYHECT